MTHKPIRFAAVTRRSRKFVVVLSVVGSVFAIPAHAAKFANHFTEFDLPNQWECRLENAEWICQSLDQEKKRDAIIVMAAKLRGDQDTLATYLEHLKAPKVYNSVQGRPVKSEPKYARETQLNDQTWIDSLHMESEIPGFFTRYLATVKEDIGILVTYSVNKDKYQEYLPEFENMVKSLKVFRKPGSLNSAGADSNLFQTIEIPQGISGDSIFPAGQADAKPKAKPKESEDNTMFFILIAAAIGFILWKKKQSGR